MASSKERQEKFKAAMKAKGMVQVAVWVHEHQASDVQIAAKQMADNKDLELRTLRHAPSGRIVKLT